MGHSACSEETPSINTKEELWLKIQPKKNVQKEWGKTGSKGIIGIKERGEINSEGLGLPSTQIK